MSELIIYECGESVAKKILKEKYDHTDYVCVIDTAPEFDLADGLNKMFNALQERGVAIKERKDLTIIAENGDTYTLAHERSYDKNGQLVVKPSNMLRHIFSRDFTVESLYIDENNQIADLTLNGVHDIERSYLRLNNNFTLKDLHYKDRMFLLYCLYKRVVDHYQWCPEIEEYLVTFEYKKLEPMKEPDEMFNKMIKQNIARLVGIMNNYFRVSEYFYTHSGMQFSASFGHKVEPRPEIPTKEKKGFFAEPARPGRRAEPLRVPVEPRRERLADNAENAAQNGRRLTVNEAGEVLIDDIPIQHILVDGRGNFITQGLAGRLIDLREQQPAQNVDNAERPAAEVPLNWGWDELRVDNAARVEAPVNIEFDAPRDDGMPAEGAAVPPAAPEPAQFVADPGDRWRLEHERLMQRLHEQQNLARKYGENKIKTAFKKRW